MKLSAQERALVQAMAEWEIIDCHEHLAPESNRLGRQVDVFTLFAHYTSGDLAVAGMSAEDYQSLSNRDLPLEVFQFGRVAGVPGEPAFGKGEMGGREVGVGFRARRRPVNRNPIIAAAVDVADGEHAGPPVLSDEAEHDPGGIVVAGGGPDPRIEVPEVPVGFATRHRLGTVKSSVSAHLAGRLGCRRRLAQRRLELRPRRRRRRARHRRLGAGRAPGPPLDSQP